MRLRLTNISLIALLFAACHPPDIDLSGDESEAEGLVRTGVAPVTPRRPSAGAIEHTLRFPEPHTHYFEVESVFPTAGEEELTLFMAVWTPGSYMVREFAGHLEALSATTLGGEALPLAEIRKNRWTVTAPGHDRVVVRYRVYARVLTVQGNFVDDDLVVLNGAGAFLCPVGRLDLEHDIALELDEESFARVATSLPPHPDGQRRFVAADYDTLVDSPIVAGDGVVRSFDVGGATFELWTFGGDELWDHDRAARDVESLVEVQAGFWGQVPFERYLFLNIAEDTGGGLEHLESTLMMTRRFAMRRGEDYRGWLGLVSHEFFHAWNAKRMRPDVLGPFDYETEVQTPSLWIVEGLTSYYDDVLLARAGLLTEEQYLVRLGDHIDQLMNTPGREIQTLSASSNDSWIKYYRRDENSRNATISYYNKGSLVGLLLDTHLRRTTAGRASLDDVMRLVYERHSGERGYSPEDFRRALAEVAGEERPEASDTDAAGPDGAIDALVDAWVDGVEPLPFEEALAYYGLVFEGEPADDGEDADGEDEDDETAGSLALTTDGAWVTRVRRGGPAHAAGINFDDEILAIDGYRVRDVESRLERYRPGDQVVLTVSRRGRLREIEVTLGRDAAADAWSISDDDPVTAAHRSHRASWLGDVRPVPGANESEPETEPSASASASPSPGSQGPQTQETQDGADSDQDG